MNSDSCEYLKVYEIHRNAYPHIHILLIFSNLKYPYNNSRWLPHDVFTKLKSTWTLGLSDYQSPIAHSSLSSINYILKYVTKTSSASHLWQRLLPANTDYTPPVSDLGYPIKKTQYAGYHSIHIPADQTLLVCHYKIKKIKLLTWSRNFVETYLNLSKNIKPCPNAP